MSSDTILAIIAVSLTAIFISVFAIECESRPLRRRNGALVTRKNS